MKRKKIILVGIDPFNGNRGVGALAYSTIYLLHTLAKQKGVELDIQILGFANTKQKRIISINGDDITITYLPFATGRGFANKIKFFISLIFSIKELSKKSYIMDISAGDSFSDIYGKDRFNTIIRPKKFFSFWGKKQMLLPQTIGPFKDPKCARLAIRSIEKCNLVLARDKMSYNYVVDNTSQKNVFELIDVAFFMPYKPDRFQDKFIHVGLNISSLMWHGGYTKDNQFGFNLNYQKLTRSIIDYFLTLPNVRLHIVPHVVEPYSHIENDYEISRLISKEYQSENLIVAPYFLDPIDAKNYISGLNFFTGARMHACIAAFSSGIPVFPLAYSRKFNGLFVDTLEYPYIGDLLVEQSEEELIIKLEEAFTNREKLTSCIKSSMDTIVKSRYNILIEKLENFIEI